jgi:hypothetical protein
LESEAINPAPGWDVQLSAPQVMLSAGHSGPKRKWEYNKGKKERNRFFRKNAREKT